jgi:hypothetical protein
LTLYVREDAILAQLDPWIESFADPIWLADGQTEDTAALAKRAGFEGRLRDLNKKIAHLTAALEEGGDLPVLLDQLRRRSAERDDLHARLAASGGGTTMSRKQIEALVAELGGITGLLSEATPEERASIYAELGIRLVYDDRTNQVTATADLSRVANRVGGATRYKLPRSLAPTEMEVSLAERLWELGFAA